MAEDAKKVANPVSLTRDERDLCYNALNTLIVITKRRYNAEVNPQIKEILGKQIAEIEATKVRFV